MSNTDNNTLQSIDERIDSYLMGEMTEAEEEKFFEDAKNDEELHDRAVTAALLAKSVKSAMKEEDEKVFDILKEAKVDQSIVEDNESEPHKAKIIPLWSKVTVTAIAACACLLIGNKYILDSNTNGFIDGTNVELGIAKGEGAAPELPGLIDNVKNNKDIPGTIDKLNKVFSQLEADEDQEAPTAGWYLAIAYVKDGNKDAAKNVLQRVIKLNPKFDEAWKLRDQLDKTFFWEK